MEEYMTEQRKEGKGREGKGRKGRKGERKEGRREGVWGGRKIGLDENRIKERRAIEGRILS